MESSSERQWLTTHNCARSNFRRFIMRSSRFVRSENFLEGWQHRRKEYRVGIFSELKVLEGVLKAMCATGIGSHALHAVLCAALDTGGCGRLALFAGGVGGAGGDAPCATLYAGGCGGCALFAGGPEEIRCVLLRMLEAVEGRLCLLEVLEVAELMCCVTAMYAGGGGGCSRLRR